jgi:hypothetical protein
MVFRVLGETNDAGVERELAALKQRYLARMRTAPNPEAEWAKVEPTYRNMLANDPNIRQVVRQRMGGGGTPERPAA